MSSWFKRFSFLWALFFLSAYGKVHAQHDSLVKQKDLYDLLRQWFGKVPFTAEEQKKRDSSELYFSVLPAVASNGSDKGFVTTIMSAFYLGDKEKTNLSTVYFTPYFTFSDQIVIPMRSYIWTKNNGFNLTGDYRFLKYPQIQYNLYDPKSSSPDSRIHYLQWRFYQSISRRVLPNLALGLGVQFDNYRNVQEDIKYNEQPSAFMRYGDTLYETYNSGGPTLELIYDNRRNTVSPKNGYYLRASFRQNLSAFGSKQIWNSIYLDGRHYITLEPKMEKVLAFWGWYWSILSGKPNYLDLPSIGWDSYGKTGRGVYRNRYRSTGILYGEVEYRQKLTENGLWGLVTFLNLTSPAVLFTQQYQRPFVGLGAGLRLKFDKRTGSKISGDLGFSNGYWTYYLTLNEFF